MGSFNLIFIFCFICVFAVLINKVCLQVTVEAVIGGSVVLPCSSTEPGHKLQDINVHWRHNSEIVYDKVKDNESQGPRYKNRAESFPDEYLRGNFSIRLKNLRYTDAGKFDCHITPSNEVHNVHLSIKESTAENDSTVMGHEILLIPVCLFLVACFICS